MSRNAQVKRFQKIKKVGEGTYGKVTKFYDHQQKIFVAVKKFKFQEDEESNSNFYQSHSDKCPQINSMPKVAQSPAHHQVFNLANRRVYSVSYDAPKNKLAITFEYLEQTLEDYMKRMGTLSPFAVQLILHQILTALKYLESRCYMHRDLKPQNIMFTKDNKIKLIDFGQTKKISFQHLIKQKQTLEVSTLWYKAPQLLLGHEYYTNKVEIWAVGCIFAELALGKPLFDSSSEIGQIFQIFKLLGTPKLNENKEIKQWQYISPSFPRFQTKDFCIPILGAKGNDLLKKILTINPSSRISISQALHHPYFEGIF